MEASVRKTLGDTNDTPQRGGMRGHPHGLLARPGLLTGNQRPTFMELAVVGGALMRWLCARYLLTTRG
ncbi:MAG: hypothetical protein H0V41_19590 [Pseudonocardiales bacterium]|nr:hypothetical protein [Pseudonocardiales bacterium]